ncbi:hypothetical protein AAW14_36345 [Streptomyces hygroscopicus]|nr:hypothetical protein [Streptomyces hygroscopicus]
MASTAPLLPQAGQSRWRMHQKQAPVTPQTQALHACKVVTDAVQDRAPVLTGFQASLALTGAPVSLAL